MKKANYKKMLKREGRVNVGATGIERIVHFINFILDNQNCTLLPKEQYSFSLLMLDAVPLELIEVAVRHKPKVTPDGVNISWQSANGRFYRFILSSVSMRLFVELRDIEMAIDAKILSDIYQRFNHKHSLKSDFCEWLAFHCTGPIFDYLTDELTMSSIPDHAYIRLLTKKALLNENLNVDHNLFVQSMTQIFEYEKVDTNEVFIDGIIKACGRKLGKSDAQAKSMMLEKCEQHAKILNNYGPISALILAWTIQLITHGTRAKDNLSQATIANYIGTISKPLFFELKEIKVSVLAEQDFPKIYARVIEMVSDSQKAIAASALSSFHVFLEDWFGVPAMFRNQIFKDVEVVPKSNVIWPHEILRINDWLDLATVDGRLIQSWRLSILLAHHKRFRVGEIFALRLRDIAFYDNHAEIHISSGKTYAAKRTEKIEGSSLLEVLHKFIQRRNLDMALPSDFLFGDPSNSSKLFRAGHFYWGLNQLLKLATGDNKVSFHTLSDTVISRELIQPLSGGETKFINELNQLATDFGHHSIIMSCSAYMHLHHISVRLSMDRALKTVSISSSIAAQWSQKSADALRKQVSLKRLNSNEYFWVNILNNETYEESLPNCGVEFPTHQPSIPDFLLKSATTNGYKVLLIIKDIASGMQFSSIASRHSVNEEFLMRVLKSLNEILLERHIISKKYVNGSVELRANAEKLIDFGFDFERVKQPKYSSLVQFLKSVKSPVDEEIRLGVYGWLQLCSKTGYQALNAEIESFHLIKLLSNTGIDVTKIAIFVSDGRKVDSCIAMIKKLFLMSYSIPPAIFRVQARRGRPDVYMSICEENVNSGSEPYGSANSMTGSRAIMLSLVVMLRMESDHE